MNSDWLVVEPYPSEKYEFLVGIMTFPIYGKIKNDRNHQPGEVVMKFTKSPWLEPFWAANGIRQPRFGPFYDRRGEVGRSREKSRDGERALKLWNFQLGN